MLRDRALTGSPQADKELKEGGGTFTTHRAIARFQRKFLCCQKVRCRTWQERLCKLSRPALPVPHQLPLSPRRVFVRRTELWRLMAAPISRARAIRAPKFPAPWQATSPDRCRGFG